MLRFIQILICLGFIQTGCGLTEQTNPTSDTAEFRLGDSLNGSPLSDPNEVKRALLAAIADDATTPGRCLHPPLSVEEPH